MLWSSHAQLSLCFSLDIVRCILKKTLQCLLLKVELSTQNNTQHNTCTLYSHGQFLAIILNTIYGLAFALDASVLLVFPLPKGSVSWHRPLPSLF